ncbi:hypothetical protein N5U20_09880 [Aliarcobacter butzleri]|uniref:hypothetical protein n=1 Tax=Aliarcobacter butzleri TaxID=28197 RepID=UPI001EDB6F58|nr:hypothetical protein [Aliarcobacter butzleri]MCG3701495.1 hypothetical protein [Aliarcobacter butzleri]MCT7564631.1 hypothetical protein [Aliarcobacter butzleri]MCT7613515.1 hypothetical protein [Aliarcobacter butzleri]MCT7622628.1 hypothetical protein [Aliarcobacter butzleri]MCT7642096.1 hypothetical protein [Aliarcobacter butzleri]
MGFVIKNNEVQRAKKIVLSKNDRKIIFTQTTKQKEILKEAIERRVKAGVERVKATAFYGE